MILGYVGKGHAAIAYVQGAYNSPVTTISSITATYTAAQTAGDLNVVVISWEASAGSVSSITDTKGNTYAVAVGPTIDSGIASQTIYYAKNIAAATANTNIVTITFAAAVPHPDLRITEYSGISTGTALDGGVGATASGTAMTSGSATTTNANDLLVGASVVAHSTTGAGSGYTERLLTTHDDIFEDEIVTVTGSYSATAPQDTAGWYIMQMAAFKAATGGGDTTPPTAPSGLTATVISSSQINLSWTASTDNVAVTGYRVERCQGASCTTFAQIASPTTTAYSDTGLTSSTSYSYRVRATDAAGNLSTYSGTASGTTSAGAAISFVQANYNSPVTNVSSVAAAYTAAQGVGDLNVVAISWEDSTSTVQSITDTKGNTYTAAVGPTTSATHATQVIYYAKNIVAATANANTVTVTWAAAIPHPDLRIAEYHGINTTIPLDVGIGASGSSTAMSSGSVTTTNANDLLIGASVVAHSTTGPGSGYTQRLLTTHDDIFEDKFVSAAGSYSATAPQDLAGWYVMQMAAFKGGSSGDTQAPTAPTGLSTTAASSTQINLSWTASTDNVGVTWYLIERCQGVGCSTYAQIAQATMTTAFSDPSVSASTAYSYRVRATDAAGNLSGYSNTSSATTPASSGDTTPPTAPTSLTATAASTTQINLAWTASTDNVGVTGYRVERCQGTSCTSFAQIVAPPSSPYNDVNLTGSTSYSYRVRATDAAGNLSGYSNTASATTPASSTTPPSITSPVSGSTVTPGQSLAITVTVSAGAFPNGVAVFGQDPLGNSDVVSVTGSTITINFPIPPNTPPGLYALTVVGMNAAGALISSAPRTVDVERTDLPSSFQIIPGTITFGSVGETRSLSVVGNFGGTPIEITRSTQLTASSEDTSIVTVQNGVVTAVARGQSTLDVHYGQSEVTAPVIVP